MSGRKTLTKDDWLTAAMELLRTRGIGGVRVLSLAKELGVSRGSFYWHFEDRNDLLRCMLDWWEREMTDSVIQLADEGRGSARKRLTSLAEDILRFERTKYEAAMNAWAETDRRVANTLKRVVNKRRDYVTSFFREMGFSPAEARIRRDLLTVYIMSEGSILTDEHLETRLRLLRRQIRFLTD